jgi:hypothetical protein
MGSHQLVGVHVFAIGSEMLESSEYQEAWPSWVGLGIFDR